MPTIDEWLALGRPELPQGQVVTGPDTSKPALTRGYLDISRRRIVVHRQGAWYVHLNRWQYAPNSTLLSNGRRVE